MHRLLADAQPQQRQSRCIGRCRADPDNDRTLLAARLAGARAQCCPKPEAKPWSAPDSFRT